MTCGSGTAGFPTAAQAKELSRNYAVIWGEISAIQAAILKATSGCYCVDGQPIDRGGQFCIIVDDNTPMTFTRGIESVTVNTGGQDYFPIVATVSFVQPGGNGASGTVIVSPSGVITAINITNTGTGYSTIYATPNYAAMVGTGADLTFNVDEITGAITSVTVINGGLGYLANEPVPISPGTQGTGAQLIVQSVGANGEILAVTVVDGGEDYQPVVTQAEIYHPLGQGFRGIVLVDNAGGITGVTVQDGGILYGTLLPHVVITGGGTGAETVTTVDNATGALLSVTVTNSGTNYDQDVIGTVVPAPDSLGTGATVSVRAEINPFGTDPYLYYLSLTDQLDSCNIKDQMEQVKNYFTQMGYMIEAQVNPNTDGTIQWEICWC